MKPTGLLHPTEATPTFPDTVGVAVLVAATAQAFDTPAGGGVVFFGADCNFFARFGSTAVSVPTTSSTGSSTSPEYNPVSRNVVSTSACTGISIISPSSGIVTMSWFKGA